MNAGNPKREREREGERGGGGKASGTYVMFSGGKRGCNAISIGGSPA